MDTDEDGDIDAADLANLRNDDETQIEDEPEKEVENKEEEKTKKTPTSDEIMADFKNFEDILNSINFEDLEVEEPEEETEAEEDDATDQEETE